MMRLILLIMIGFSVVYANDVFKDSTTGLMWQDNKDARTIIENWTHAKRYCSDLSLDGYSDWRLPSREELADLFTKKDKLKYVVASPFYWSSSEYADDTSKAWIVYFYGGTGSYNKSNKSFVLCVRGRQ